VHAIGGRAGDSSSFSDHTLVAAAAATGCLLLSCRWGLAATGASLLVALGRVAIGAHYPSDVAVALLIGAGAVAALLPLRSRTQGLLGRLIGVDQPASAPRRTSSASASPPWSYSPYSAAGWSPESRTTACASR